MYGWEHNLHQESVANVKDTLLNKNQTDIHLEAKEIEEQANIFKSCCKTRQNIMKVYINDYDAIKPEVEKKILVKICKVCSNIFLRRKSNSPNKKFHINSCYMIKENCYKTCVNEDINQAVNYRIMIEDEKIYPQTRIFNDHARFQIHLINVYKYFFADCQKSIQQRYRTLHLAIGYFTQLIMKTHGLSFQNVELLIPTCLLLASKLDEIDYNLPSFEYIVQHMKNSEHMNNYSLRFYKEDYIELERFVLKTLDWNISQLTPYHFVQALLSQGVVGNHEKVKVTISNSEQNSERNNDDTNVRSPYGVKNQTNFSRKQSSSNKEQAQKINDSKNLDKNCESKIDEENIDTEIIDTDIEIAKQIRKLAEYFVELSVLVLPLQNYSSSIVGSACILAARKICNIEPLWGKEIEILSCYSIDKLIDPMNILINASQKIKFGDDYYDTASIVGDPPACINIEIDESIFASANPNYQSVDIFTPCKLENSKMIEDHEYEDLLNKSDYNSKKLSKSEIKDEPSQIMILNLKEEREKRRQK